METRISYGEKQVWIARRRTWVPIKIAKKEGLLKPKTIKLKRRTNALFGGFKF